jgi:hypothetical protein
MENNDEKSEKEYKYICEKCEFYTNACSAYKIHISSEKHINGKRAIRCDKKYPEKCPKCNYKPTGYTTFLQHTLIYHSTKEEREMKFKYFCKNCDYGTFSEKYFENHKKTEKHITLNTQI